LARKTFPVSRFKASLIIGILRDYSTPSRDVLISWNSVSTTLTIQTRYVGCPLRDPTWCEFPFWWQHIPHRLSLGNGDVGMGKWLGLYDGPVAALLRRNCVLFSRPVCPQSHSPRRIIRMRQNPTGFYLPSIGEAAFGQIQFSEPMAKARGLDPISLCRKIQFNISCTCPFDHFRFIAGILKLQTR
jgi:hypothetical protein